MFAIGTFVVVHVVLVLLVPKTLLPMITGGLRPPNAGKTDHE
jgi:thiosulfate reductase cytochrome b subunit